MGAALTHQDERGAHPARCAWWACAMVPAPSGPCWWGPGQGPPYAPEPSPSSPWRTDDTLYQSGTTQPLSSEGAAPGLTARKGSAGAGQGPCSGRGGALTGPISGPLAA